MQARVGEQRFDLQEAGQVQTEENNDRSGDAGEQRLVLREDLSDFGGDGAQRDEDDAETDDKGGGVDHYFGEELAFLHFEVPHAHRGNQGNVSGDEREDAGGEEGDQSCDEGGER